MQPANHHDFPDRIGEWIPERVIGRGAVAGVYLCRDAAGDEVALKWMDASMSIHFERFEREIHVLARLDHPSIVGYRDHGVFQGRPFLVMD
jgi:serine/threonine protein kinase